MSKVRRRKWFIGGIISAIIITIIFLSGLLQGLELVTYDYRLIINSILNYDKQDQIVIVEIDDKSVKTLGDWPWPRDYHAQLIGKLDKAGAKVIGFDIIFDLPTTQEDDKIFSKQLAKSSKVILPYILDLKAIRKIGETKFKLVDIDYPLSKFKNRAIGLGYINLIPDHDGKIRRINLLPKEEIIPFAILLAQYFTGVKRELGEREQLITYHHQREYFKRISYSSILKGNFNPDFFKEKLVLIGATSASLQDYLMTPLAMLKGYVPGVVVHAEIIDNYLNNNFIQEIKTFKIIIFILSFSLITSFLYQRLAPLSGVSLLLILFILILSISLLLLIKYDLMIPVIPFILVSVINFIVSNLIWYFQIEKRKDKLYNIFSRYLAPQVVDQVIELPEEDYLRGERQEITILFIDLVGFTNFSEKESTIKVVDLLNKYLSIVTTEVFRLEGTLDKFLGDGVMVFFNAPISQSDHVYRAVELAVRLQNEVNNNSEFPLQISIGINTGEAIVGNIGSTIRSDYTAIGDVVNTAARIEEMAAGGEILVGEGIYQIIKKNINTKFIEETKLRGKDRKIKIYKILNENVLL